MKLQQKYRFEFMGRDWLVLNETMDEKSKWKKIAND